MDSELGQGEEQVVRGGKGKSLKQELSKLNLPCLGATVYSV